MVLLIFLIIDAAFIQEVKGSFELGALLIYDAFLLLYTASHSSYPHKSTVVYILQDLCLYTILIRATASLDNILSCGNQPRVLEFEAMLGNL
jgi:hypothetical protein